MTLVRPLVALALAHLLGALLRALPGLAKSASLREALTTPLASPSSALVTVALLYGLSLHTFGFPVVATILAALVAEARAPRSAVPAFSLGRAGALVLATLAGAVLARPMVPTCWDEFVWLGKARFESEGFGAGVRAALDPAAHLMPPGYPTLWPAASGWLALGADDLEALTGGASMLVIVAMGALVERLARTFSARGESLVFLVVALVVGAPLVLVHARSTYVDLPVGLLGAALLLELASEGPSMAAATTLAIVLVGLKDEGIAHLAAALAGAASYRGSLRGLPAAFRGGALGGLVALGAWQLAVSLNHVGRDHAGLTPAFAWSLSLAPLLVRHATELTSWGLFWPAVIVVAVLNRRSPTVRAFAVAVALNLACVAAMLVVGPPRVRAFAENGTLLNRVLVQLWPFATGLVLCTVEKK